MSLVLTRQSVSAPVGTQHTWPLVITAVSTVDGLDSEIFVYHAALDDDPVNDLDLFECVASLPQMDEIGLVPVLEEGAYVVPYYRSDTLSFACRSAAEAEELWVKIKADAKDLYNNFQYFVDLSVEDTYTLP
jgi:hypothetical protein